MNIEYRPNIPNKSKVFRMVSPVSGGKPSKYSLLGARLAKLARAQKVLFLGFKNHSYEYQILIKQTIL